MYMKKAAIISLLGTILSLPVLPSASFAISNSDLKKETYVTVYSENAWKWTEDLFGARDQIIVHFIGKSTYQTYEMVKTWVPFGDVAVTGLTENIDSTMAEGIKTGLWEGLGLIAKTVSPKELIDIKERLEKLDKSVDTYKLIKKSIEEKNNEPNTLTALKILKYSILRSNHYPLDQADWSFVHFGIYKNGFFDFTGPAMKSNLPNGKVGMDQGETYITIWDGSSFGLGNTTCPYLNETSVRDVYYGIVQTLEGKKVSGDLGRYAQEMALAYYSEDVVKVLRENPPKEMNAGKNPDSKKTTTSKSSSSPQTYEEDRDIVREAQTILKKLGYDPGPIDGIWGDMTESAVSRFQRAYNLYVDGILGNQTLSKLREVNAVSSRPVAKPSTPSSSTSETKQGTVYTESSSLNVRSGPGTNYDVIDAIPKGTAVSILASSGTWYKVSYKTSKGNITGYVSQQYIKLK